MQDLTIIGAGPAGLTASIYASCFKLSHTIISANIGGQMLLAPDILNYPGFTEISGKELTNRMVEQVKARGGMIIQERATTIIHTDQGFTAKTQEGHIYKSKTILLATGTERRRLNIPGEMEYVGRGVHYCATCEKFDYEGKVCAVVGGANSAVQAAVQLAEAARQVIMLYRGTALRGDQIWIDDIKTLPNVQVMYQTEAKEIMGNGQQVTSIKIQTTDGTKELSIDKLFIEIGGVPGTALVAPLGIALDPGGYIQVNERMETSIPGVFAAGDLVTHEYSIEQISTAVGLGARAAASIFRYLTNEHAPSLWGSSQIKR